MDFQLYICYILVDGVLYPLFLSWALIAHISHFIVTRIVAEFFLSNSQFPDLLHFLYDPNDFSHPCWIDDHLLSYRQTA